MATEKRDRVFSLEEVKRHKADAWMAIDGVVYDVHAFLDEHPGGRDYILDYSGIDATHIFSSEEIHGHSDKAFAMLEQYRIGVLNGYREPTESENAKGKVAKTMVDMKKAVAPQVVKMGSDYQIWVHSTVAQSGFRIFESSFLEAFSTYPWYYIFFMWVPVITLTFYWSIVNGSGWYKSVLAFPAGVLVWTIVEYILHRFVFHMDSSSPLGNFFHFLIHGIHHLTPNDPSRLAFPPVFGAILGYAIYSFIISTFGTGIPQAVFSGGAFTYLMYDTLHYYFHHGDISWLPGYVRRLKSRHLDHHYKHEDKNYGVTTPLWDYVFDTLDRSVKYV